MYEGVLIIDTVRLDNVYEGVLIIDTSVYEGVLIIDISKIRQCV